MIIIRKRRIALISGIVLLAVFAFTFKTAKTNSTVQTVSLPVSSKVIVLDAGHGKPDEGNYLLTLINNN